MYLFLLDRPDGEAECPNVVAPIPVARIEVETVSIAAIEVRVGPIVTVAPYVVERAITEAMTTGGGEEDRVTVRSCDLHTLDSVQVSPFPCAAL